MRTLKTLVGGLNFPEGPRWHDGKLYFSDMHDHRVKAVDMSGRMSNICLVPNRPSGLGWLPDGKTLIVGESFGARLTAFDIAAEGSLSNRLEFAKTAPYVPDGICLDAEGAIWVASPTKSEVIRVKQGGEITEHIKVSTDAYACMLGGPDRKTLFVATSESAEPEQCRKKPTGRIEITEVEVPGAGLP